MLAQVSSMCLATKNRIQKIVLPRVAQELLQLIGKHSLAARVLCHNFVLIIHEAIRQTNTSEAASVLASIDTKSGQPQAIVFSRPLHTSSAFSGSVQEKILLVDSKGILQLETALKSYAVVAGPVETTKLIQALIDILTWLIPSHGKIKIPIKQGRIEINEIEVVEYSVQEIR